MPPIKPNPAPRPLTHREKIFSRPARQVARELDAVIHKVDSFTADGKVTRAERKALVGELNDTIKLASAMVARQSEPVLELMDRMKAWTRNGKLTPKAEEALKQLKGERRHVIDRALADAKRHPLDKPGWKRTFDGVRTRDFTYAGLKVHAVAIDLADPRVSLQTNTEAQRGKTVDGFAKAANAEVAINGDFFSYGSYKPSGVAMTNGKVWSNTAGQDYEGFLAFRGRHAELETIHRDAAPWATNMVSSRPTVLVDGKLVLTDPAKNAQTARTGMGLSKDGRVLYLVAVEGVSGVRGLTATGVGKLLKSMGADDAMSMDSGGSAQMYVKGRGLVQRSTDPGGRRAVANVLMVQSR